jgi:hypothetical protein
MYSPAPTAKGSSASAQRFWPASGKVRGVRFSTFVKMCAALGCEPGDLLDYQFDPADFEAHQTTLGYPFNLREPLLTKWVIPPHSRHRRPPSAAMIMLQSQPPRGA